MKFYLFFALSAVIYFGMVTAQYDDYNEVDSAPDRESRQVSSYAFIPPGGECERAWFSYAEHCGGFKGGNGGSCDKHCEKKGFPRSWCRPYYCLCHKGTDLGKDCELKQTYG